MSLCAQPLSGLFPSTSAHAVEKIMGNKKRLDVRNCRKRIESLPMVGGGLDYSAPFQRAIELIGKRWTGAVVKALLPAPARFNQLLAGIPGISDRVLTERLRELEAEGIVERLVDPGPPVRVSYRLTSRGHALEPVFGAVKEWAESWLEPVAAVAG
jgi:DNA-binding HxlR family transcriptional regulator